MLVAMLIVGGTIICACGTCFAYGLRRAWRFADAEADDEAAKKRKKELETERSAVCNPAGKCSHAAANREAAPTAVAFSAAVSAALGIFMWGIWMDPAGWMDPVASLLSKAALAMLNYAICTSAGVLVMAVYLRRVPDILVQLRRKPNGAVYQQICEQIIAEDARRKGKVNDTLLDNNGLDSVSQVATFSIGVLVNLLCGSPLPAALLVLGDWMAGKPALKYAVKYYVKRYYRPAAADSVTVEQLKKVTDYREPCVAVAKHLQALS